MASKWFVWKIMHESIPRGVHHAGANPRPQPRPNLPLLPSPKPASAVARSHSGRMLFPGAPSIRLQFTRRKGPQGGIPKVTQRRLISTSVLLIFTGYSHSWLQLEWKHGGNSHAS